MIYLDHAATTPMGQEVLKAMLPFFKKNYGNPAALYKIGRKAAIALTEARVEVAKILHCLPDEIIFTAGGTESDNLAIFGVLKNYLSSAVKYHLITSQIEHPAVLNSFKHLAELGFAVTYLPVDKYGLINPEQFMKALRPNTLFVSFMYGNNEIGTIEPIAEISNIIKNYRHIQQIDVMSPNPIYPIFHTDACQAAGYLDLDVVKLGVDLMTLNGSKIYGPKQVGVLYKNNNIKIAPLLFGGNQEFGYRPGTENVAGAVGFARALRLVTDNKNKENKRLIKLRDYFIMELLKIPATILNGHHNKRLPNNINVTFRRAEGESIMLKLDALGIYASTGSACHSMSLEPSHVILAIGQDAGDAHGSMRFTLGQTTSKKNVDCVLKVLPKIIKELRAMSAISH